MEVESTRCASELPKQRLDPIGYPRPLGADEVRVKERGSIMRAPHSWTPKWRSLYIPRNLFHTLLLTTFEGNFHINSFKTGVRWVRCLYFVGNCVDFWLSTHFSRSLSCSSEGLRLLPAARQRVAAGPTGGAIRAGVWRGRQVVGSRCLAPSHWSPWEAAAG